MQELTFEQVEEVSGGLVFLIPPAVGGALKAAGMIGGFMGGVGAGYTLANELIGFYDKVMTQ
ncbi:hypothetical protein [Rheinheimera soli]|uniref:hypothetical protein n=1 Tax=Rheinheimera soli TaxID=443616 RepID=UPI001E48E7A5|nr:hypothetical protein [Rheinheimera soli]